MSTTGDERRPRIPRWVARASAFLTVAAQRIRVIAASTPANFREELERLTGALRRGDLGPPRFVYACPPEHTDLRLALLAAAEKLEAEQGLGVIYGARARELEEEAAICEAVGSPDLWRCARVRYARRDAFDDHADALAAHWLAEGEAPAPIDEVRSDDERDPSSLLCRVREEIGARKLPLRVLVSANIASLAATGDGFVQIVADRPIGRRDVERTVLHEIEGHALPRLAGERAAIGIFAVGTARGSDDQEGRALALERRMGFLDHGRRRELALRHHAARAVAEGADFLATVDVLRREGAEVSDALRIAARVYRGGGLAREGVYLPALLRVEAAISADEGIEAVLAAGRVSVDAAPALRAWVTT